MIYAKEELGGMRVLHVNQNNVDFIHAVTFIQRFSELFKDNHHFKEIRKQSIRYTNKSYDKFMSCFSAQQNGSDEQVYFLINLMSHNKIGYILH